MAYWGKPYSWSISTEIIGEQRLHMYLEPKIWTWFISRIQYTQTSKGAFCHLNILRLFSPLWGTIVPLPSLSPDPGSVIWCVPASLHLWLTSVWVLIISCQCLMPHGSLHAPFTLPSSQPILYTALVSCFDTCWLHSFADSRVSPDLHASSPGTALSASLILSVLPFHVLNPTSWCVFKPDANVRCLHLFCFLETRFLCVPLALLLDQAGLRSPGAGVSDVCESPDVGSGNPTWFFCNCNVCSQTLSLTFPVPFVLLYFVDRVCVPWLSSN